MPADQYFVDTARYHAARLGQGAPGHATSVSVCGAVNGELTESGLGVQCFASLEAARAVFPDLDPSFDTLRFTRATTYPDGRHLRFETHRAHAFYGHRSTAGADRAQKNRHGL